MPTTIFLRRRRICLNPPPIWIEGKYTDLGKWMDGWETRRRRSPRLDEKFDWCVIRLGMPGEIKGVVVDTAFSRQFPVALLASMPARLTASRILLNY